ncbi:MAG: peptidoglycan DD-metalloendopeptidase family protein [Hyphomicrobiaceae bacterium]|jgi:septal ring factor EnvC (AmiA/AmiB activator)|nr:peptidoglycan DD-metalloendopeptidase family protein [Methyloceanibacter sp.]MDX2449986.1 peptidoglycan DD-metalloendopeptidase family protein [Hyphomicrobiaceae bacterium]
MAQPDPYAFLRQRIRFALLLAGLLCVLPWQALAEDDLSRDEARERLDKTEQELKSSQVKAEGLTKDLVALAEERARLNSKLIEAGESVQASEAKLSETEAKLAELNEQVGVIQSSITERKVAIVKMLSAMQRIGRTPPPAIVTRRDDALGVVRGAMLLADVYPELKYQADNLSKELEGLVTIEDAIRARRDEQKQETDQLTGERGRLDRLLAEKKAKHAQSEVELVQVKQSAEQLAGEVTSLNELIERLGVQIAKAEVAQYDAEIAAEKALRERLQQEVMATPANENVIELKPESTKLAFASPSRLKPAMPFWQAKGTLRMPAQGHKMTAFGDTGADGTTLKGISLKTREEARITAPADGWVVYAGPFRSYGQLLIINAGGGYHLLIAGMSRIDVSLGQFVLAGEPIAVMGGPAAPSFSGDENYSPVLYVEFRKDGKPVDPGPWWAEASEKVQG